MEILVYKNVIAIELVNKGHKITRLETNRKQPQKTVFFFLKEKNIEQEIKNLKRKYWNDK